MQQGDSVLVTNDLGYSVTGTIQFVLDDGTISVRTANKSYIVVSSERDKYGKYNIKKVGSSKKKI